MKKLLLLSVIIFAAFYCYGQSTNELNKDTTKCKNNPLVVINNIDQIYNTQIESTAFIDPKMIDSISVYHNKGLASQYKNGLIKIKMKSKLDFVGLKELLEKYSINETTLPIYIDSSLICHPENIYFVLKAVKSVKIEQEKKTNIRYLSILSTTPIHHQKAGEIYIKGK